VKAFVYPLEKNIPLNEISVRKNAERAFFLVSLNEKALETKTLKLDRPAEG
jgi:hypothetical protein